MTLSFFEFDTVLCFRGWLLPLCFAVLRRSTSKYTDILHACRFRAVLLLLVLLLVLYLSSAGSGFEKQATELMSQSLIGLGLREKGMLDTAHEENPTTLIPKACNSWNTAGVSYTRAA